MAVPRTTTGAFVRGYNPACDATDGCCFANAFAAKPVVVLVPDAAEPCCAAARALNLMNVRYFLAAYGVRFDTPLYQPM